MDCVATGCNNTVCSKQKVIIIKHKNNILIRTGCNNQYTQSYCILIRTYTKNLVCSISLAATSRSRQPLHPSLSRKRPNLSSTRAHVRTYLQGASSWARREAAGDQLRHHRNLHPTSIGGPILQSRHRRRIPPLKAWPNPRRSVAA